MTLLLSPAQLAAIRRHVEADYPHEACGLLGGLADGERKRVLNVIPAPNARLDSPRNRYLIEPEAFRRLLEVLENEGLDVMGVYHSHPDHPARPSAFDREQAWPWFSYLIVEVREGKARTENSWLLANDRQGFVEEPVDIEEGTIAWQSQS